MEEINIEWLQRDPVRQGVTVHLRRTVVRGKHATITFKTLFLKNGVFDPLPRRWSAEELKKARLRVNSFIEQNQSCFLGGDKLILNPRVSARPRVELLRSLVGK